MSFDKTELNGLFTQRREFAAKMKDGFDYRIEIELLERRIKSLLCL